jgi:hypothetical protein
MVAQQPLLLVGLHIRLLGANRDRLKPRLLLVMFFTELNLDQEVQLAVHTILPQKIDTLVLEELGVSQQLRLRRL